MRYIIALLVWATVASLALAEVTEDERAACFAYMKQHDQVHDAEGLQDFFRLTGWETIVHTCHKAEYASLDWIICYDLTNALLYNSKHVGCAKMLEELPPIVEEGGRQSPPSQQRGRDNVPEWLKL